MVLAGDAAYIIPFGVDIANHVDIVHLAFIINGGEQGLILFVKVPRLESDGVAIAPERSSVLHDPVGLTPHGQPRVGGTHVEVGVQVVVQFIPSFVIIVVRIVAEVRRDVGQLGFRVDDHDIALPAIRGVKTGLRLRGILIVPVRRPCPLHDRAQQGENQENLCCFHVFYC